MKDLVMAGNGVLHGHIHKLNNLTYIHGHIHHTKENDVKAESDYYSNDNNTETTGIERSSSDIEGANTRVDTINSFLEEDNGVCGLNKNFIDCKHFEFINYDTEYSKLNNINNSTVNSNWASQLFNDQLVMPPNKRRKFEEIKEEEDTSMKMCNDCNPKVLEVCCEFEHNKTENLRDNSLNPTDFIESRNHDSVNGKSIKREKSMGSNNLDLDIYTESLNLLNKDKLDPFFDTRSINDFNADNHLIKQKTMENISIPDLSCNLTCETACTFQNKNDAYNNNVYLDTTKVRENYEELYPNITKPLGSTDLHKKDCHDHIVNSEADLKILQDLCDISSIYSLPFTKHSMHDSENDHHQYEHTKEELENHYHSSHHEHHHHFVNFHSHSLLKEGRNDLIENNNGIRSQYNNFRQINQFLPGKPQNKDHLSYERLKSWPNAVNPSTFHHHVQNYNLQPNDDSESDIINSDTIKTASELSTIDFNWNFNTPSESKYYSIQCKWNNCGETFASLVDLQKHLIYEHVSKEDYQNISLDKDEVICNWKDCEFEGEDICSLLSHINRKHGINFDMKFINLYDTEDKKKNKGNSNSPNSLNIPTPTSTSIEYSSPNGKNDSLCKWDKCGKLFENEEMLNNHVEKTHLLSRQSEYYCKWENCDRRFTQKQKLVRHLRVHTHYKPFTCKTCGKNFSNQEILIQHQRVHSGEKPYKCDMCGNSFSSASSLKVHKRTHTGEKPLSCNVCGKRFNSSSNLSKHVKTHKKQYKCPKCLKSYDSEVKLISHAKRCK
ncbi:hypothetical protein TPHA_0O01440 [Tetrapisispora phaffii CBS 4417]|uniref:C2H2-type domain-containing protein n=1 Tax=Tetrapisispora phaffii (strain ATCC 24235 / CBS 4417 / NBRC 1672 / NRRL Y-8282 / UCD 70-5) TaxID=1071381 RepID=G8C1T3_TETPH|nr:hypothetical protein TPHA_0O01440 [Tetrapisispora phaffii CBS 4417]CCE66111.1 hypothetical protein TPHA_0O01440 [Tetrapisispora phaffii CBS 4417]